MKLGMDINEIIIRSAVPADAKELLNIYAPYVTDTAITFEYEIPSLQEFEERIRTTLAKFPYLAAEQNGKLIGYAYASPFKQRAAYSRAVETSIYVKLEEKGKGIGRLLYEMLEAVLARQNVLNLNACIAYPNPESIGFHEHLGYRTIAHFTQCGFKLGKWYDMIWMEKMLGEHTEEPAAFLPFPEIRTQTGL